MRNFIFYQHLLRISFIVLIFTQLFSESFSAKVKLGIETSITKNAKSTKSLLRSDSTLRNLRKCCPMEYVVKEDIIKGIICVPVLVQAFPNGSNSGDKNVSGSDNKIDESDYNINNESEIFKPGSNGIPSCSLGRSRILNNRNGIWFKIFPETNEVKVGLDYFLWAAWIPVEKDSYCLGIDDIGLNKKLNNSNSKGYHDEDSDAILVFCKLDDSVLTEFIIHRYIYGLSSLATCIPILFTVAIFVHLKIHLNPRKWILMSYFFAYYCTCAIHGIQILVYLNNLEQEATIWCRLYNHMFVYFCCVFGTACMFVSLDIFWCFWTMNSQLGIIQRSKSGIIITIISTWLGPLILYVGGELWREYYAKYPPNLAWKKCMSLNFDAIEFLIMVQFAFKFGIYLSTSLLIYKHKKSTSFATPQAQQDFNTSTTLYAKLFVTTGMPFTCLAIDYCFANEDPMAWYWFAARFPHSVIGIYIFLVFGLSAEVRRKWHQIHMSAEEKAMESMKQSNNSDRSCSGRSNAFHYTKNCSQSSLISTSVSGIRQNTN